MQGTESLNGPQARADPTSVDPLIRAITADGNKLLCCLSHNILGS